jgi:hypothetical protein
MACLCVLNTLDGPSLEWWFGYGLTSEMLANQTVKRRSLRGTRVPTVAVQARVFRVDVRPALTGTPNLPRSESRGHWVPVYPEEVVVMRVTHNANLFARSGTE